MAAKKETKTKKKVVEQEVQEVAAAPVETEVIAEKATKAKEKKQAKLDLTKVDQKSLTKLQKEYTEYRLEIVLGKQNNTAKLRQMRKDLARINMILNSQKVK